MKTKPGKGHRVYWVQVDELSFKMSRICWDTWENIRGGYKYNLFATREEAKSALKKIGRILRGEQ